MTDAWIWGLMASIILLAIGTSLKAVNAVHAKKLSDDECARLRKQLDMLNNPTNKEPLNHHPISHAGTPQSAVKAGDLIITGGAGGSHGDGGSVHIVGGTYKAGDA